MTKNTNAKPPFFGLVLVIGIAVIALIALGTHLKKSANDLISFSKNTQEKSELVKTDWEIISDNEIDGWKTLVSNDQKFKIDYPENFEVVEQELGFSFTEPVVTSSEYTRVLISPYDEESSKLFLSWIAQTAVISTNDKVSILNLPEEFSYFNNGNYQGYIQDDGQYYSVYLLINNKIWRFDLSGGDTGSSYSSNGVVVLNKMITSFEIEEEINGNQSNPYKISPLFENRFPLDTSSSEKLTYAFLDILSFEYPKENTVELFTEKSIYVTDNQPLSVPIAGETLNIRLDSSSPVGRENCNQEQFLSGVKYSCQQRSYIFLSHKGQNIRIEYPNDKYEEIVESMELVTGQSLNLIGRNCENQKLSISNFSINISSEVVKKYNLQDVISCSKEDQYAFAEIYNEQGNSLISVLFFFGNGSHWVDYPHYFKNEEDFLKVALEEKNYFLDITDPGPFGISDQGLWITVYRQLQNSESEISARSVGFMKLNNGEIQTLIRKYGEKTPPNIQDAPLYIVPEKNHKQFKQEVILLIQDRSTQTYKEFLKYKNSIDNDLLGIELT